MTFQLLQFLHEVLTRLWIEFFELFFCRLREVECHHGQMEKSDMPLCAEARNWH